MHSWAVSSVTGHTKSSEFYVHNPQFGKNEIIDIGNSQSLHVEGNNRTSKVSATRPGLAKLIGKLYIARKFESPEIDNHIAANACSMDYTNTESLKHVP